VGVCGCRTLSDVIGRCGGAGFGCLGGASVCVGAACRKDVLSQKARRVLWAEKNGSTDMSRASPLRACRKLGADLDSLSLYLYAG
jgi:hypothetical protein